MKILRTLLLFCLVPHFTGCTHAEENGPFEYKEIYLPEKDTSLATELHLNNVDDEWGLWGHHLSAVLPERPAAEVFALVDGQRSGDQFCFSSDMLFGYIERYIEDNFGEGPQERFAILPNDNAEVCQCERCTELGNTPTTASPAVFKMIERLAQRFPGHQFFTSYYLTTKTLPATTLPANTGVLVSAMTYPLSAVATPEEEAFETLLKSWTEKMEHVFVWDYINNFDDYFTPFPVFTAMQRRLQLYERAGVKGIFLNGSGSDYSTFSKLKTVVLGQLMQDPHHDWFALLKDACHKYYPVAGEAIADFIHTQEQWTAEQGRHLPLYEGVAKAKEAYLPETSFVDFHRQLRDLASKAKGTEQKELQQMSRAMMLTRLELQRLRGYTDNTQPMLDELKALSQQGVKVYSESCWFVDSYVKEYQALCAHANQIRKTDLLLTVPLKALSTLDEEYADVSVLNDGLWGIPSNYHCGQLLSSEETLKIGIPCENGMRQLRVSLTANVLFHIALPRQLILSCEGRELGRVTPVALPDNPNRAIVDFNLPASAKGMLELTLVRNPDERTMAIDEIEGYVL